MLRSSFVETGHFNGSKPPTCHKNKLLTVGFVRDLRHGVLSGWRVAPRRLQL